MRKLLLIFIALGSALIAQSQTLPSTTPGSQWGCPSSPSKGTFDTTCFIRTAEIRLGQGKFDHYGSSDMVYAVIPYNRPSFAIAFAIGWDYYRNVLGYDKMSINQWFATAIQENGFATYNNGVMLNPTQPFNVPDVESGTTSIPALYPRGGTNNSCAGAGHCWHVGQNGSDGPFHNTSTGYQTIAPYVPSRYPAPYTTYHPLFNSNFVSAVMNKTFYDLSIYRRAQYANGVDLAPIESVANDPYGVEAAQAYAYNIGPNGANSISNAMGAGYTLPAGITTNTNWAVNYYSGGVSCYAQRVASITAVLDNNEAYAASHYPGACGGAVANWDFFDFYDAQIKWDSVALTIDQLLITMYPEFNAAGRTTFKNTVKAVFDGIDADGNGAISFRYEMGPVIDEIIINLPKDDPAMNAMYALYNSGCNLGCMAPYTEIKPDGSTALCPNQDVLLVANVDSPSPTLTLQWYRNGVAVPAGSGGTNDSLIVNYANAGTYTLVVCWQTVRTKTPFTPVTCCAQPKCSVTITQATGCSSCTMNFNPVITANACTGMYNGSVALTVSNSPGGNLIYSWTGPTSGSTTTSATNYTITGLRDGRYTITVQSQTTPTCRMIKTITIVPTTAIKESLAATANNGGCPVQLQASLVVQRPSSCNLQISYGSLGAYNWDLSYAQELRVNGVTYLTMNKGYSATTLADGSNGPWDWSPWSWPSVGTGNAPNVTTVSVNDGDTISVFGTNIVPMGTAVPAHVDAGLHMQGTGVSFTQVGTTTTATGVYFRYKGYPTPSTAPTNGTRQMQNSWVVTCPVVSPPAYTYSWTPTTGLNNPNIANPTASINTPPSVVYTVTATHPANAACQLTATATVTRSCTPLPVDLIYFNATLTDGVVTLDWTTANERDCKTYHVERSRDGVTFERIAAVTCLNVSRVHEYASVDNNPYSGVSWYRIAAEDIDGAVTYTETKIINVNTATAFIYPNPFSHEVNITLGGAQEEHATVLVRDINGRILQTYHVAGNAHLTIGTELPAAVYIVEVSNTYGVKNYKVIKQ